MTEESSLSNSIKLKNKIREYNNILGRNGFKSDYDKEKEEKDKQILLKAQRDKEENMDEVKTMNSLLLSAKLAVIRDKQIEEKKRIKLHNKKIEEKLNIIEEYERLKEEINRKKMEKKLNEKRMEGKKEIEKIILLNKKLKEEQKNLLKKEYDENVRYQEQIKKEEIEKEQKEKEKVKQIVREMLDANKRSLELKRIRKLKEIQEDQDIIEYNKQKFLEEQNKLKELKELKQLKELETSKLRENQKKMIDNKNILEDIFTKRAVEEGRRAERQKSLDEALKYKKLKEEMNKANDDLIEFRNKIKFEEAAEKNREYEEIIKKFKIEIKKEKEKEKKTIEIMLKYREDLQKMIALKEEEKKAKRREIMEEGKKIKQNQEEYYNRLQKIKTRKIAELKIMNIPNKYIHDLKKYKIKK